jgi:hypothetical protein
LVVQPPGVAESHAITDTDCLNFNTVVLRRLSLVALAEICDLIEPEEEANVMIGQAGQIQKYSRRRRITDFKGMLRWRASRKGRGFLL